MAYKDESHSDLSWHHFPYRKSSGSPLTQASRMAAQELHLGLLGLVSWH